MPDDKTQRRRARGEHFIIAVTKAAANYKVGTGMSAFDLIGAYASLICGEIMLYKPEERGEIIDLAVAAIRGGVARLTEFETLERSGKAN